jgi:hypothetical protein
MSFDDQYYFIRRPMGDDATPSLKADDDTSMRDYITEAQPLSEPLVFLNSWRKMNVKKQIKEKIRSILFEGTNLLVTGKIRRALLEHEIPHLSMCPSVYIDDRDKWHEDYWFLTFTETFDCWDRKASIYVDDPIEGDEVKLYHAKKFRLDEQLLNGIPLEQRLLFKMGGSMRAFITVHQSMLPAFLTSNRDGVEFQKISDFGTT